MMLDEAYEYVSMAHEAEGEQRAEFGMGAVSMGFDPYDAMGAYDGYRASDDETYAEAQRIIAAASDRDTWKLVGERIDTSISDNNDDIPF